MGAIVPLTPPPTRPAADGVGDCYADHHLGGAAGGQYPIELNYEATVTLATI
jgi:hypothetical protein